MPYQELFEYCQQQDIPVSRKLIRAKLLEVTETERIAFAVSGNLNPNDVRGMFLSIESDHPWVRQHGSHVVVISRAIYAKTEGGNQCWDRFITTKEMMHLFDTEEEASDTGEKFDEILSAFFMTYDGTSPVVGSEVRCFWRAMGVLCPEEARKDLMQKVSSGSLSNFDAALKLKIPEQYVGHVLSDKYLNIMDDILNAD